LFEGNGLASGNRSSDAGNIGNIEYVTALVLLYTNFRRRLCF
jgi:hypothetical protein